MKNDTFGYARVSTEQQNHDRQPDAVKKALKLYNTHQYSIKEIEELTGI